MATRTQRTGIAAMTGRHSQNRMISAKPCGADTSVHASGEPLDRINKKGQVMNDRSQNTNLEQSLQTLASELFPGAHLVTERRGYVHHGIYVGHGEVMHYVGFKGFLRCGPVERTSLADFSDGYGFHVEAASQAKYVGAEVVRRAASRLGEDNYRLLTNNCEHFCTWCLFGESRSKQVETLLSHPWRAVQTLVAILCSLNGMHANLINRNLSQRLAA